jgi:hypothetical protein
MNFGIESKIKYFYVYFVDLQTNEHKQLFKDLKLWKPLLYYLQLRL